MIVGQCGAVLSVRQDNDAFSVWVRHTEELSQSCYNENFERLNSLLVSQQFYFQPHTVRAFIASRRIPSNSYPEHSGQEAECTAFTSHPNQNNKQWNGPEGTKAASSYHSHHYRRKEESSKEIKWPGGSSTKFFSHWIVRIRQRDLCNS